MPILLQSLLYQIRFFFRVPWIALQELFLSWMRERKHLKTDHAKDLALFEVKEGQLKCVGCKLCEVACPAQAIIIDTALDGTGMPSPSRFDVDMGKCISCGLCEKACPVDALGLVPRTLLMVEEKEKLYHTKETLILNGRSLHSKGTL